MRRYGLSIFPAFLLIIFSACKKPVEPSQPGTASFRYSDSVFYVRSTSYQVAPINNRSGTYTAFPENLLIDPSTGNITVTITGKGLESQTGLKYKIRFQETGTGFVDSTYITIAGINYLDRIYYLDQHDTIVSPLYNGSLSTSLPAGTYGISPDNRLAIDPSTGKINLKECMRRGMFDLPAENGEWEEVTVEYKSADGSNQATNRIDIALYFYNRLTDVPVNVSELMRAHQTMVLGVNQSPIPVTIGPFDNDLPDNVAMNRPRPPCIIIIAN
jgi:hypothetical protein